MGIESSRSRRVEAVESNEHEHSRDEERLPDIPRENALVPVAPSAQEVTRLHEVRERLGLEKDVPLLEYQTRLLEYHPEDVPLVEGEVIEFTPRQIEAAQQEIIEGEYTEVEVLERAAEKASQERVSAMRDALAREYGADRLGSVYVWEEMRASFSAQKQSELIRTMATVGSEAEAGSLLGQILAYFEALLFPQSSSLAGLADIDPHRMLATYIEEHPDLTHDERGEVEDAIHLVGLHDQVHLFKDGETDALESTVELQQQLLASDSGSDPSRSGFFEMRKSLEQADAALQLDFDSKPGYAEQRPLYLENQRDIGRLQESLHRYEATAYLEHHGASEEHEESFSR